jgi:hypothetical protein
MLHLLDATQGQFWRKKEGEYYTIFSHAIHHLALAGLGIPREPWLASLALGFLLATPPSSPTIQPYVPSSSQIGLPFEPTEGYLMISNHHTTAGFASCPQSIPGLRDLNAVCYTEGVALCSHLSRDFIYMSARARNNSRTSSTKSQ